MRRPLAALGAALLACAGRHASAPPLPPAVPVPLAAFPSQPSDACAPLDLAAIGPRDAALVLDASQSTQDMTGRDVNGNGRVGDVALKQLARDAFDLVFSDSQDSILAAEVVGAWSATRLLARAPVRFALVSLRGSPPSGSVYATSASNEPHAKLETPLTLDPNALQAGFERLLAEGSKRNTDLAAGIRAALDALGVSREPSVSRVVLLVSDGVQSPGAADGASDIAGALTSTAAAGVVVHTFLMLDSDGETQRRTFYAPRLSARQEVPLQRIAKATGGTYTELPGFVDLHCALVEAIAR